MSVISALVQSGFVQFNPDARTGINKALNEKKLLWHLIPI